MSIIIFSFSFPHPVTLAGVLEMSTAYLPVNTNWNNYVNDSESTYDDLQNESKVRLMNIANDACQMFHGQRFVDIV